MADKFVHCHHVVGGVDAAKQGAWVGIEQNQASLGQNIDLLQHCVHPCHCFWKEFNFYLFSVLTSHEKISVCNCIATEKSFAVIVDSVGLFFFYILRYYW